MAHFDTVSKAASLTNTNLGKIEPNLTEEQL
jgi:hypothetical protein